jgi:hypothetical protein
MVVFIAEAAGVIALFFPFLTGIFEGTIFGNPQSQSAVLISVVYLGS